MYVKIRHLTKTIKRKVVLRDVNAEFERGNIDNVRIPAHFRFCSSLRC